MAGESLNKIELEKAETLKETSKWIPEHQRNQDWEFYVLVIDIDKFKTLIFWNKGKILYFCKF